VFRLGPDAWRPISANTSLTWQGLLFLCALSLFYAGVFREFQGERRARELVTVIVAVATLATLAGFVQRVSADPNRIYGIWKPPLAAHVFGPYPNRSHYAGYVVMAIPLALGLAVEALFLTRRLWSRRARGFTALGEPEGSAAALRLMLVLFNVAGVLAAGSRTAVLACAVSALAVLAALGRRLFWPALAVAAIAAGGLALVDVDWFVRNVGLQRLESDRMIVWRDMLPIVRDFPLLGVGWNALGDVYAWRYQTVYKWAFWREAHNEYLQVLLTTGISGAAIVTGLLWLLLRAALRATSKGPFGVGLFGAVVANAVTNISDFNLQIPANAATFVAIAGVLMAYRHAAHAEGDVDGLPKGASPSY
jgi:O-antigen ligase